MSDDKRNRSAENTRAIVRSAIRDSKAISVQARIRRTRIERDIAKLRTLQTRALAVDVAKRVEAQLLESLLLYEQVLRSLADAESHLQALLQLDRELPAFQQSDPAGKSAEPVSL